MVFVFHFLPESLCDRRCLSLDVLIYLSNVCYLPLVRSRSRSRGCHLLYTIEKVKN